MDLNRNYSLLLLCFFLLSNAMLSIEAHESSIVIYGDKYCDPCFEYMSDIEGAFKEAGITNIRMEDFGINKEAREKLNSINDRMNVPYNMRGNIAVIVDEKYLFENYVPAEIIIDFLLNYKEDYQSIVIFRDTGRESYIMMDDKGEVIECKIEASIGDCFNGSDSNLSSSLTENYVYLVFIIIIILVMSIVLSMQRKKKQN
jgi:hypothetical protein